MHPLVVPVVRFLYGLRRRSKDENTRALQQRGESLQSLVIREATTDDIPALSRLHVETFNETHGKGPPWEMREAQYRQKFAETDGSWFCFVVSRQSGDLVGFAIGNPSDDAGSEGRLNKIYLLRGYQRLGLGRRLVGHVVQRFLTQGVTAMVLFSEAENPSIWFYEALGGERMVSDKGEFHGGYRWRDLQRLAAACPIE